MKKFALMLSLIPALSLAAPVMSADHGEHKEREGKCAGKARHHRADMMPRYLKSVALTQEQNEQISQLMQQHREQTREQMHGKRGEWQAYRQLSFADTLDQARLDEMLENSAASFKAHAKQRAELNHAIFQTLTAEQQTEVMQRMAEYRDGSGERKKYKN
ncbi:MAG: Spy/CpxP family protein refolding chaperone [Methylophaga sp.]|nr:Spy/CpxP family protein refolding chaperone [Methylophaga sp.]